MWILWEKRFCRFGDSCVNLHPKKHCTSFKQQGGCNRGIYCDFLHIHKDCKFWLAGFCRKASSDCEHKHDPVKKGAKPSHSRSKSQEGAPKEGQIFNPKSAKVTVPFLDQRLDQLISSEVQKVVQQAMENYSPRSMVTRNLQATQDQPEAPFQPPQSWNQQGMYQGVQQGRFPEFFPNNWNPQ